MPPRSGSQPGAQCSRRQVPAFFIGIYLTTEIAAHWLWPVNETGGDDLDLRLVPGRRMRGPGDGDPPRGRVRVRGVAGGREKPGGVPSWLQHDETPTCPPCAQPMSFMAQLEEGRDYRTAMNFGGDGCGYAFACAPCKEGPFLWQC